MEPNQNERLPGVVPAGPGVAREPSAFAGPRMFAALRHRNYRLFFSGQLIAMTGQWMQWTALGWLVYELTNSPFLLGAVGAAGQAPSWLFALPGGAVADRFARRKVLLVTQTSAMALAFALAVLATTPWIKAWHVALLSAIGGTVFAFDMPARQAFVVEMVGREDLMNAIALNSSLFNMARLIGPAVAGVVVAKFGTPACFFVNGFGFTAVIVALLLIRVPHPQRREHKTSVWQEVASGLRYLKGEPRLVSLLLLLGGVGIFVWSYGVLLPVFARDVLHGGAKTLGLLMSATGVGALAGALTLASLGDYPRKYLLQFVGLGVTTAAVLGFAASRWLGLSLVLLAVAGWGTVALMATANTLVQMMVADDMRGRVMGVWSLVFAGSMPLGSLLMGTMAQHWGAPLATAIGAVAGAVVAAGIAAAFAKAWRSQAVATPE